MANLLGLGDDKVEIQADYKKFLKWCEKEEKSWREERDIDIIDGDFVLQEKRLARVVDINPTVIKEYEDATGEKFEVVGFIIQSD